MMLTHTLNKNEVTWTWGGVLNISKYCSIIFSLLSYQCYYIILTFFFSHRFIYMSQLSTWSWDMSSSLIYGINHTNIYVELAIGNCTQYRTFYLKLRQLAIGLATKYFNSWSQRLARLRTWHLHPNSKLNSKQLTEPRLWCAGGDCKSPYSLQLVWTPP